MMSGSEQYLQHRPNPFSSRNTYDDSDSGYDDTAVSSGLLSEDITDVDENPEIDIRKHEPEGKNKPLNLLHLLSGKQNSKKKPQKKDSKAERSKEGTDELTDLSSSKSESEVSFPKPESLEQLEQKMYDSKKSMSAMDLLRARTKKKNESFISPDEHVEIVSDNDSLDEPVEVLEERPVNAVAVRDIFSNFAPKKTKGKDGKWRLNVRFKISPARLAEIKKFEDPFRTRGNVGSGTSMLNTLMKKRPSKMVTLRLSPEFLQSIQKSLNPLYTKSSGIKTGKSANSVFAQMMQTASISAYPKLTPLQKAKELDPPDIERGIMHVYETDTCNTRQHCFEQLSPKAIKNITFHMDGSFFATYEIDEATKRKRSLIHITTTNTEDICDFVADRSPLAFEEETHIRIYKDFIQNHSPESNRLWPDKFSPKSTDQLLLDPQTKYTLRRWIENAFAILKTQSTKTPRNIKIKEQKQRRQKMQDFIVDDFEEDSEETEEDVFVPVLILEGQSGSGKSAAVYAAMNSLNGYVHEINSGQNRSRRELYGPLKEFCTTNIINKNDQEKSFQRGLVFFEDCDVLFEQDKTFWTAVQDVINFSKRPLVISVQDSTVIPRSIYEQAQEQNAILTFENHDTAAFEQYVWLCCFSQGFDLTQNALSWVTAQSGKYAHDVRKALMQCQWICSADEDLSSDEVLTLDIQADEPDDTKIESLESLASVCDLHSEADTIESNMRSSKLQEHHPNELLDIYTVDDGQMLRPFPEPEECNIGTYLKELVPHEVKLPEERNYIDFLGLENKETTKGNPGVSELSYVHQKSIK
ncbi:uncharacterized protein CXQ87_002428 [Candidozyma duobushaemuli]|uniref:ATPase AAA-type core domain-containing protein n=1 Tax=Candidozyma duobushaemuli TaxID=1231522 RepID=A0A2V1A884_9ASCO|nr:uncharacterized protein CXQ87_002428 [[Candida] duobushaemulonis]PVH14300.1 hypothetical protein CXQ87_002428 [[Candida] duobushaemulonis]